MLDVPKANVLVAEDDAVLASIISLHLQHEKYAVTVAINGREAWERAQAETFDLLLTDEQMPVMTGQELCRLLQNDFRYTQLPIIFVTAKRFEMMQHIKDELHLSAVIGKPFSPRSLMATVEAALAAKTPMLTP